MDTNSTLRSSNRKYKILIIILNGLLTISSGFFVYHIIAHSNWTFAPNWNMFNSIFIIPLYIIGLIIMFANWSKFNFARDTYIKTTYSDGTSKTEKSYDITDVIFGNFFLPFLGRFVIVPLMVAAVIYYPIMCIVWFVGSIFPWILAILIAGLVACAWLFSSAWESHFIIYLVSVLFITIAFAYGGYYISQIVSLSYQYTPSNEVTTGVDIDGSEYDEINIDESEFE